MTEPTAAPGDSPRRRRSAPGEPNSDTGFRWQALFQRSSDAFFVLDAQRRLRFVNRAWEALTGLAAADVRLLACKRRRPAGAGDPLPDVLAHALCPPAEVMQGESGRARRRLPAGDAGGRRVWDVEFLPLQNGGRVSGVLGRIIPIAEEASAVAAPLPEKLIDLRERCTRRFDFALLESQVPAVRRLCQQVRLAAGLSVPVLLTGAAGTGKETLARVIHYRGLGGERPLAAVDCARLPADVVGRLLFGDQPLPGQPGAIYLREPGRLPRDYQTRLSERIAAGTGPRILAGCRVTPAEQVSSGQLADELLAAFPLVLEVPSLRQRAEDLPLLIERMLARANEEGGPRAEGLTPAASDAVASHVDSGNLRELYATLSAARRHSGRALIDVGDLPATMRLRQAAGTPAAPERPLPLDELLEQTERRLIELALRRAKGHRGKAAEILGIWRARLLRRLEALGLGGT